MEEGKLLSEALSTVKIQVQQMKRHLVRPHIVLTSCGVDHPFAYRWLWGSVVWGI